MRQLLSAIDGLTLPGRGDVRVTGDWSVRPREALLRLVRGPDAEFRDPCRFALLEAYPDTDSLRKLGPIIASVVGLDLEDLRPDAFASAVAPDPEHALESYVELVDRVWGLDDLLRYAQTDRPAARKLAAVRNAHSRWAEAVRTAILGPPVP